MSPRLASLAAPIMGLVLLIASSAVRAEPLDIVTMLDAPAEYTADYSLTQDGETWRGTVVHSPGHERRDFTTEFGTQAILLRRDTDFAALLWPDRKWYLSTSLLALTGLLGGTEKIALDRHADGSEVVGGEHCARYLVEGAFDGRIWVTKDGILMRAVGRARLGGRERTIATQLAHLQRASVDADEFELPLGYHGIPVSPRLFQSAQ